MGLSPTTALERRRRKRRRAKLKAALPAAGIVRALGTASIAKRKPPLAVVRPSWKLLGLAGVAGVAATGAVIARNRRAQRDVEPDELRERLHERLGAVGSEPRERPPDAAA